MDEIQMRDALERIGRIADVMIGHGPGAVDAYYRHEGRMAEGLPTSFGQMRDHAKEIRRISTESLAALDN